VFKVLVGFFCWGVLIVYILFTLFWYRLGGFFYLSLSDFLNTYLLTP